MRQARKTGFKRIVSTKAKISLVLGFLSLCLVLPGVPGIILGLLSLRDIERSKGRLRGRELAVGGILTSSIMPLTVVVLLLLYQLAPRDTEVARTDPQTAQVESKKTTETKKNPPTETKKNLDPVVSSEHLKKIGKALHDYHDAKFKLPPAAILSKDQKPLLSWRVQILPYLGTEEKKLYSKFKLTQPWDSTENRKLLEQMPKVYECPRFQAAGKANGYTYYQALVGPLTVMGNPTPLNFGSIDSADGRENTIIIVEAGSPVPWTKPADLEYSPSGPLPAMGGPIRNDFEALFVDGKVKMVDRKKIGEKQIRAHITWNAGD